MLELVELPFVLPLGGVFLRFLRLISDLYSFRCSVGSGRGFLTSTEICLGALICIDSFLAELLFGVCMRLWIMMMRMIYLPSYEYNFYYLLYLLGRRFIKVHIRDVSLGFAPIEAVDTDIFHQIRF